MKRNFFPETFWRQAARQEAIVMREVKEQALADQVFDLVAEATEVKVDEDTSMVTLTLSIATLREVAQAAGMSQQEIATLLDLPETIAEIDPDEETENEE